MFQSNATISKRKKGILRAPFRTYPWTRLVPRYSANSPSGCFLRVARSSTCQQRSFRTQEYRPVPLRHMAAPFNTHTRLPPAAPDTSHRCMCRCVLCVCVCACECISARVFPEGNAVVECARRSVLSFFMSWYSHKGERC